MVESSIVNVTSRAEPKPPAGVIESLGIGFETVVSHIWLIVIPVLLDVFLWAGPRLTMAPLALRFTAVFDALQQQNGGAPGAVDIQFVNGLGERLNVFALFSTAPVGVPSLMVENLLNRLAQTQPPILFSNSGWRLFVWLASVSLGDSSGLHGQPALINTDWQIYVVLMAFMFLMVSVASMLTPGLDPGRFASPGGQGSIAGWTITSELQLVLVSLGLTLIGLLLAALYMSQVGSVLREDKPGLREVLRRSMINWAKLTALNVLFRLFAFFLGIPALIVIGVLQLASPLLAGLLASVLVTAFLWFMVYISFTMQSVVLQDRGVFGAIWDSIRLVQISLTSVVGLLLVGFLLNWGMNYIWSLTSSDSWLMLASIAGHAFISTGLLAATFVFYKDRRRWWVETREWLLAQKKTTDNRR